MKYTAAATLASLLISHGAMANDYEPAMRQFLEGEIANWANSEVIVSAVLEQNSLTHGYDQATIDSLDTAWRAEVGQPASPTITPVISNATSDYLRQIVEDSGGRITEIFVMDEHGLNVAASDVTSDYWQGDEDKFTETHNRGSGSVHFSDVEFDESTQRYQAQISVAVTDPATGAAVGAVTIGVDADSLM